MFISVIDNESDVGIIVKFKYRIFSANQMFKDYCLLCFLLLLTIIDVKIILSLTHCIYIPKCVPKSLLTLFSDCGIGLGHANQ